MIFILHARFKDKHPETKNDFEHGLFTLKTNLIPLSAI